MNLQDCYMEEDLFPMIFAEYEERAYGILFYNAENKDSFDSNHAVIYKDRIHDIRQVLTDIVGFYKMNGSRPIIYQSMSDDDWFGEIKNELNEAGFESWVEEQEYMLIQKMKDFMKLYLVFYQEKKYLLKKNLHMLEHLINI